MKRKEEPRTIKNEVKSYIVKEGFTMKKIADLLDDEGRTTLQNLSNKLTRGTIKYSEIKEIADILGYDIKWEKKNK
ncbi:MAG: LLM class flavin-dependent oxidoreductase [Clostridia bacterium]|nr:LLM class flavin-dependent oxidoreductase [Clostridia bacterium]